MILFGMPDQFVIVPTIALVKDGGYLRLIVAIFTFGVSIRLFKCK